jgi:molybdopterin-binding protein
MPRKQQGWITFQSSVEERQILEEYCQQSQRTKTEILRELVRSLNRTDNSVASSSEPLQVEAVDVKRDVSFSSVSFSSSEMPAVRISARNILKSKIIRLVKGLVNTEVTLEIAPGITLISIITTTSAQELGLVEGKTVYAVIKSNNVMIAEEG